MHFRTGIRILFLICFLWFIIHIVYTVIDGSTDKGEAADIAVILGNKVNKDGSLSPRLAKRLECGLELFKEGRVKKLMVSGGLGKEGFYEGDKMKEYLVNQGVPDSLIIVDNYGKSTVATVNNTLKLKDSLQFSKVIAVSQYYHLTRTKKLFRSRGFHNVTSSSPKYFEVRDIYALAREFVAFYAQ